MKAADRAVSISKRYVECREALLRAGNDDNYDLHAAAEAYSLDRRKSVSSVARAYDLTVPA